MTNLCSIHRHLDPDCELCKTRPEDVFPNWKEKLAEAKALGEIVCHKCGFVRYNWPDRLCPLCNHVCSAECDA